MTCACCSWSLSCGRQPACPWLTMGNWFPTPKRGCRPPSARRAAACAGSVQAAGTAFPAPSRSVGSGWFALAAAAPTWGPCGRCKSFPSLQSSCGQAGSCHAASAVAAHTVLVPRSRAGGAGLQLQDQCQTAARWGPAGSSRVGVAVLAFPGAPGTCTWCFHLAEPRGCSLRRAPAVMEVPEKMHGSSVSLHDTASTCGCCTLGCRCACLVLAVPEDNPALGERGALLA